MTPTGNYVCIHYIEKETMLHVIELGRVQPYEGIVATIGPKVEQIKAGDHVLFDRQAGHEVKYEDNVYRFVHEDDLLAVL